MIALVDLKISNLGSVLQAFRLVSAPPVEAASRDNLGSASAILLPGVGAFGDGMASLREQGLAEPIRAAASRGVPVFGICLGMQLLAETSEEHGTHEGLGVVRGHVRRLEATEPGFRVPNIGWCDVVTSRPSVLFPKNGGGSFYHVHSYHLVPVDGATAAAHIEFSGRRVVVALQAGNVFGVQFHPEKSQDDGLDVLASFFTHLRATGRA
jgi:glutamine amidotransferase